MIPALLAFVLPVATPPNAIVSSCGVIKVYELVYKFLQGGNLIIYTVCMTALQNVINPV